MATLVILYHVQAFIQKKLTGGQNATFQKNGGRSHYPYANAHGHLGGLPQEIFVLRARVVSVLGVLSLSTNNLIITQKSIA